jgi:Inhibitor of vertebrate lysozyme (Ivy)
MTSDVKSGEGLESGVRVGRGHGTMRRRSQPREGPMSARHLSLALACGAALLAARPATAALDAALDRQVGGIFSNACADRSQVMVRLYGDVLDIERGAVAVKASRLKASTQPPPGPPVADFKAVVRGEVKGGDGVQLVLTHNAKGLFARIDGGEKSLAPLGPGITGQTLRHCDPNRNALPGAVAEAPKGPADLLRDPKFKSAYAQVLGPLARERWIARLEGPAPPIRSVTLGGAEYTLAAACKPHDCSEHNLVVLWNAPQGHLLGLVQQRGAKTLLGAPPPALAAQIDKLWAGEWRQK